MITKEELEEAGAEELAQTLLALYINNPKLQKQLDIIFAGLEKNPKRLVLLIKKEISTLKRSTAFVDYYGSDDLADHLEQIRISIIEDLTKKSLEDALKLMHDFLNLHVNTMERCDDSNGVVGNVFSEGYKNLGEIYSKVSKPVEEVTQIVFDFFTTNNYGLCDDVIIDFKEALGEEGLNLLYNKLKEASDEKDNYDSIRGLKDIADCQNNISAYIEACNLKDSFSNNDYIEIATRFIDIKKASESLQWLDKVDTGKIPQDKITPLRIKALELNADYEQAQQIRISWFNNTLSSIVYKKILTNAKPEFEEQFKKSAIEKAFDFLNLEAAINFLISIQELKKCGEFVRLKIDQLSGDSYYTLRPAAKILQQVDPLASILLYRKMTQAVLEGAKYKYYNYAAQDLSLCAILSTQVIDWKEDESHDIYFTNMQESHKRKVSFWPQYDKALEKQNTDLKKQKFKMKK